MENNIHEKKIPLNEIIKEIYLKRNISVNKLNTADSKYKDFVKDNTRKLKDTFKALKCDIDQFKNKKDRYELPIVVAEIFRIYLEEESGKGSYISKLKNKKFLDITLEEKIDFINKVTKRIQEAYKGEVNEEKVKIELENLHRGWLEEARYSEIVKENILEIEQSMNLVLESSMIEVASISEFDGLINVNNGVYSKLSDEEILEQINFNGSIDTPYSLKLSKKDRLELLFYLNSFMINSIKEWRRIVDMACVIREENITEVGLNDEKTISSEDLIKLAIKDYEEMVIETNKPIVVPKHNREEINKIIEEIRAELKKKRSTK